MRCSKSGSKSEAYGNTSYLKKQEKHWISNCTLYLKQLEKEEEEQQQQQQ